MCSVRDQNVHKIAVADGSTGHIVVTTYCTIRLEKISRCLTAKHQDSKHSKTPNLLSMAMY